MNTIRLAGVCLLVACGGSPPPRTPAPLANEPAAQPAALATTQPGAPSAPPPKVAEIDDLSLIPVDSEVVGGFNLGHVRDSALWKQFGPALLATAAGDLAAFKAACGFDPRETIDTLVFGAKDFDTGPRGVFVVRGLDKATITSCVDKAKTAASGNMTIVVDGDVVLITDKDGKTSALTFLADKILVAVTGPGADRAAVEQVARGQTTSLKSSPTFMNMFGKLDTKASLWMLVNGNAAFMSKMAQLGVKPKAVFGSVDVTERVDLDVRFRLTGASEATSLADMVKNQTNNPQVKALFDRFDVTTDDADVRFDVMLTEPKLRQLVSLLGGMLGGMMSASPADASSDADDVDTKPKAKGKAKAPKGKKAR